MPFANIYPLYVQKAEKKGRTKEEVDTVIEWLTGYDSLALRVVIDAKTDIEGFFANAPRIHPNAGMITGVICGHRIELIDDKLMRQIRCLDKLVDELAKGKPMEKIMRK